MSDPRRPSRSRPAPTPPRLLGLAALAAAVLALVPGGSFAAAETPVAGPEAPFTWVELGSGVFAAVDRGGRAGSNAGVVIGDDGVLVVDTLFRPEASAALLAEIRRRTDKPIRYVVNTHYHVDHTAGDGLFKSAGAVLIAHENVHGWIHAWNPRIFGRPLRPAEAQMIAALPEPDVGLKGPATIWLGSRRVDVRPIEGHTGGDLLVTVPDAGAVFCGDIFWRRIPPNTVDGRLQPWIASLRGLAGAPNAARERFVPGHGEVGDAQDVREAADFLSALRADVAQGRAAGLSGAALQASVLQRLKPRYGDWVAFSAMAPREIGDAEAEAAGRKVTPPPEP